MSPEWKSLTPKGRIKKLVGVVGEVIGDHDYIVTRKSKVNGYRSSEEHLIGRSLFAGFAYEHLTSKLTNVIAEALKEMQKDSEKTIYKFGTHSDLPSHYTSHITRLKEIGPKGDHYRHLYNEIWKQIKPLERDIDERPAGHT